MKKRLQKIAIWTVATFVLMFGLGTVLHATIDHPCPKRNMQQCKRAHNHPPSDPNGKGGGEVAAGTKVQSGDCMSDGGNPDDSSPDAFPKECNCYVYCFFHGKGLPEAVIQGLGFNK
jgi:hypothetical protein